MNQRDLADLERDFIDHVDLQNALFDVFRKYSEMAYGERKLLPMLWINRPDRKPKTILFLIETSGKIKSLHAAKKRQQVVTPMVPSDVLKDIISEKPKVRPYPISFSPYFPDRTKGTVPVPTSQDPPTFRR